MIYGILYDYEDDENDDVNNDDGDGGDAYDNILSLE